MSETLSNIYPNIAFSSGSLHPVGAEAATKPTTTSALGRSIISAHHAGREIGRGINKQMRPSNLGEIFGPEHVSVSVLMGRMVDQRRLQEILDAAEVPVHSRDIPDNRSSLGAGTQAIRSMLALDPSGAKGHIGWALINTGSGRQQRKKTAEGLEIATKEDVTRIKGNPDFFKGRQGDRLMQQLKRADGEVILAVEIDATGGQSIKDYEEMMKRLRGDHEGSHLKVRLDVDTGGLGLALENYPDLDAEGRNKTVVSAVEDLMTGPLGDAIEIFSVNQYRPKAPIYHAPMDEEGGAVDIPGVALLVGAGIREGVLPKDVTFLFEPDPRDQEDIFHGERGKAIFEGMRYAFNQGAGNVQEPALSAGR